MPYQTFKAAEVKLPGPYYWILRPTTNRPNGEVIVINVEMDAAGYLVAHGCGCNQLYADIILRNSPLCHLNGEFIPLVPRDELKAAFDEAGSCSWEESRTESIVSGKYNLRDEIIIPNA